VNWTAIGAVASALSVFVALLVFAFQTRRWRVTIQADLILRLLERFNSEEMKKTRSNAAKELLKGPGGNQALSDLLDFLSGVASLIDLKALSKRLAYNHFQYWILGYWYFAQDYIERERAEHEPRSWRGLERLVRKLEPLRLKSGLCLRPASRDEFLQREAALT
jgi:hypothetical protein